ncbi:hypothetical protein ZWY2020_044515 [Hordeum vulgare]|nr:hypothetical protein ZWY2020_044515 [Hordeum vulgare]
MGRALPFPHLIQPRPFSRAEYPAPAAGVGLSPARRMFPSQRRRHRPSGSRSPARRSPGAARDGAASSKICPRRSAAGARRRTQSGSPAEQIRSVVDRLLYLSVNEDPLRRPPVAVPQGTHHHLL